MDHKILISYPFATALLDTLLQATNIYLWSLPTLGDYLCRTSLVGTSITRQDKGLVEDYDWVFFVGHLVGRNKKNF